LHRWALKERLNAEQQRNRTHQEIASFSMETIVLDISATHIVESLVSFWNISNAPPSTKVAASFELVVALCRSA